MYHNPVCLFNGLQTDYDTDLESYEYPLLFHGENGFNTDSSDSNLNREPSSTYFDAPWFVSEAVIVIFSRSQDMLMKNLDRTMTNNRWSIPVVMIAISCAFTGATYWLHWDTDFTTERLLVEWWIGFIIAIILVQMFSAVAWMSGYLVNFCFCIHVVDDDSESLDKGVSFPIRNL